MDSLRAIHGDDDGDRVNVPSDSAPPPTAGVDGGAVDESPDSVIAASASDEKTGSDQADGIKEEVETPASVDLPSSDGIEAEKNDHLVPPNCPNLGTETDGNEEGEEEEEPPAKRQKQAEIQITPPRDNGKQSAAKAGKKSKKKSKDVWMSTSRKGKKKTKHASNSNFKSKNANDGETSTGPKLLIAPLARFPDRNDDSAEMKICLSKVYKAEKVELSEDRLTASSIKGYRMVRATRGVTTGAWYFEIKVMFLGESGHTRLGWSTEKGDLQAPVGYDGNSYGYRDIDGSKVHKALREVYGKEGYKEGDVIGFYINLPDGDSYAPKPPRLVWHKGQRYVTAPDPKEDPPKIVPGSEVSYFKNGVCQGVAFTDLYGGRYYPAASMYTLPNQPPCVVQFNFGPDFECFPEDFGECPVPKAMVEVPYQSYDTAVENGNPWNITRMCPMLKVIKEENCKIVNGAKMVG